jgi:hypothetical protein
VPPPFFVARPENEAVEGVGAHGAGAVDDDAPEEPLHRLRRQALAHLALLLMLMVLLLLLVLPGLLLWWRARGRRFSVLLRPVL